MIISKIKLINWKNFQQVDVNLKSRAFVVGANASGKSNFLDAIRFMRDIVKQAGGLQFAVEQRGGVSKIRCLAARQISYVGIEIHLSEDEKSVKPIWKYSLAFKHSGGGIFAKQATIVYENVLDINGKSILNRSEDDQQTEDSETLKFTFLEQPNSNKRFRDIYHFFQEIQYLHIVPQLIRDSDSYMLATNKEDFYGRNLLERMDKTNIKTRDSFLKRINEVLQLAVPQLKNIEFKKDKSGIPHLEATYEHWRAKGAKQQESQFSDGTLRLIGFMWALLDGQETILLEEPELYLHSAIVQQLPEFIYKLQRRKGRIRQVIISTHSYDILNSPGIGGNETIVLSPTKEGTRIDTAIEMNDVKDYLEAGLSIAEAVIPKVAPKNIQQILQLKDRD
ncbi:MAG: AAA family ATPase [Sphingobacteriales bacterium]|nr:AAA family ATPase [Sphingobacteriales bacterium]